MKHIKGQYVNLLSRTIGKGKYLVNGRFDYEGRISNVKLRSSNYEEVKLYHNINWKNWVIFILVLFS